VSKGILATGQIRPIEPIDNPILLFAKAPQRARLRRFQEGFAFLATDPLDPLAPGFYPDDRAFPAFPQAIAGIDLDGILEALRLDQIAQGVAGLLGPILLAVLSYANP